MRDLPIIFSDINKLAKTGLKTDQDLKTFKNIANELLFEAPKEEGGKARFNDISSDEFKKIINVFNELYNDRSLHPRVRILAARFAYLKYASSLPVTGLPLTDPYIQGIIHWSQKIQDFNDGSDQIVTDVKLKQIEILTSLYRRRKRFDLALEYVEKLMPIMLRSLDYKYDDISAVLSLIVSLREEMIQPEHTLNSPEIIELIKAIQNEIAFYGNVPESKRTIELYLSPREMQQLQAMQKGQPFYVQDSPTADQENIDDIEADSITAQGRVLWVLAEQWDAEKNYELAKGKLRKLLAVTPGPHGEAPDYKLATMWLRASSSTTSNNNNNAQQAREFNPSYQKHH